jgi:hypothetical protein
MRAKPNLSLRTYWIMLCVELHAEIPSAPDDPGEDKRPLVGYYQNFGVTTTTEPEACRLVSDQIQDGSIEWSESRISFDVIDRLDPEILSRANDWNSEGIWYKSGRVFFPRED